MTEHRASLSVDLDNLWAYQRTHGDPEWEKLGSYLHIAVPRMLEAFDEAGVKATVFIVGADARRADADRLLGPITAAGHEVGNHSFGHEVWLHRSPVAVIEQELRSADEAIQQATGARPVGFRGPGFTWSGDVLRAVAKLGYQFDASILPSFIGPLARRRLLQTAQLSVADRQLRQDLFGSFGNLFRPNRPYRWRFPEGGSLLEIPVTTMPFARIPFHQSYVVYLASYSRRIAQTYLRVSLEICRCTRVEPSLLFHPLDWLTGQEVPRLRFFPGMGLGAATKLALLRDSLRLLRESFTVETMGRQADCLSAEVHLSECPV